MTEKQRKFLYFPAWNRCAKANDWVMVRGRLLANLDNCRAQFAKCDNEAARDAGLQVLDIADRLALQEHRAVMADDLRHACNSLAGGPPFRTSSADLKTGEVSRVVALFDLLSNTSDLGATVRWLNPEMADRDSLAAYLRRVAPEGTLRAIARNAWGTTEWQEQSAGSLRWLLKTVKGKKPKVQCPKPSM